MGIEGGLGRAQGQGEWLGALTVVAGAVVAADGVVVGDGGVMAVKDVGRNVLEVVPDGDLVAGRPAASTVK